MALTLRDINVLNAQNPRTIELIEENLLAAPEIGIFPGRVIPGTTATTLVRTDVPRGGFRRMNDPLPLGASSYENRQIQLAYFDSPLSIDEPVAQADARGPAHILSLEESGAIRGYMLTAGSQVWYGKNAANPLSTGGQGFVGARDFIDSNMVVNAGGSTSNGCYSAWFVVAKEGFVTLLAGNQSVVSLNAWGRYPVTKTNIAGQSGTSFSWINNVAGWTGVAWENKYALGCIKNLDASHLLTDSLATQMLAKFPVGVTPTHVFINRTAKQGLQSSRSVTIFGQGDVLPGGGQGTVVPKVDMILGIPVVTTDSLLATENAW